MLPPVWRSSALPDSVRLRCDGAPPCNMLTICNARPQAVTQLKT